MKKHDEYRHRLGAYVTGSLDPLERAETEDHLTGCGACRDELSVLSPLPAALARVPSPDLTAPGPLVADDRVGQLAIAAARAIRHRTRRSKIRATSAVGLVAAAAIAAAISGAVGSGGGADPVPVRILSLHTTSGGSGSYASTGSAALDTRPWGTQLVLTLDHLPAVKEFVASISGPNGNQIVGAWGSTPDGHMVVQLATALHPDAVGRLTISTVTGTVVLHS